jgi:hypothetical protein
MKASVTGSLVDEGRGMFDMMQGVTAFHTVVAAQHYGCLIDLAALLQRSS